MTEEKIKEELHWVLTSLSTAGLVILLLGVTIFALAKFGVFGKLIDGIVEMKRLSTGMNAAILAEIQDAIKRLLANDENIKNQIGVMEEKVSRNSEAIRDIRTTALKKAIFDKSLYLIDRMAEGIRYLLDGYNSEVGDYLHTQLCFEDLPIWNGLCRQMNAKQFWKSERDRPADWKTESPKRAPQKKEREENQNGNGI